MVKISVVTPAYNESQTILAWALEVEKELLWIHQNIVRLNPKLLVVDDGSTDGTFEKLDENRKQFQFIDLMLIRLGKNSGHQAALIAGIFESSHESDVIITLDSDGEHPPKLIRDLFKHWQAGHKIVHTIRKEHQGLPWSKRTSSKIFYRLIAFLSGLPIRPGMADYKLWDGKTVRSLEKDFLSCGSTRMFAVFLAPHAPVVEFEQVLIPGRESRYSVRKMISLAMQSLIFYSAAPLRIFLIFSVFIILLSLPFLVKAILNPYIENWFYFSVIFILGLITLAIGILSEYLIRIQLRKALPKFWIQERR